MDKNLKTKFIKLNVGGKLFTTTKSTLCKYKDSFLEKLCQENEKSLSSEKDENGAFMIDRDGKLFKYILNFLRDNQLCLTGNVTLESIKIEADFYLLPELVQYCDNRIELKKEFDPIKLNVGGKIFCSTEKVLCKSPYFDRMFDENKEKDNFLMIPEKPIFIDQDGEYFECVLNYLRTDFLVLKDNCPLKGVKAESCFFKLHKLSWDCDDKLEKLGFYK